MSKLLESVKKIVCPVVLTASLTAGTIAYSPEPVHADHRNDLKNFRDWYMIQHGIVNNLLRYAEYEQLRQHLQQPQNVHIYHHYQKNYDRNRDGKVDNPDSIPQTFTANYWKELDNRKGTSITNEIFGLNAQRYRSDQPFHLGFYMPVKGIQGKSYAVELWGPKKKLAKKYSGFFNKDLIIKRFHPNLKDIIKDKNHGEGNFTAVFYYNNGVWNKKQFELIDSEPRVIKKPDKIFPDTFIFNHKIKNKKVCPLEDIVWNDVDYSRKVFMEGEPITIYSFSPNHKHDGKLCEITLFDEKKNVIQNYRGHFSKKNTNFHSHHSDLQPGDYTVFFRLDGKYQKDIEFKVFPDPEKPSIPQAPKQKPKPNKNKDIIFQEVKQ